MAGMEPVAVAFTPEQILEAVASDPRINAAAVQRAGEIELARHRGLMPWPESKDEDGDTD